MAKDVIKLRILKEGTYSGLSRWALNPTTSVFGGRLNMGETGVILPQTEELQRLPVNTRN